MKRKSKYVGRPQPGDGVFGPEFSAEVGVGKPLPIGYTWFGIHKEFRVEQGDKCEADRKIFWRLRGTKQWLPFEATDWAIESMLYRHNEAINYDSKKGKDGGDKPILYLNSTMRFGVTLANIMHKIKGGPRTDTSKTCVGAENESMGRCQSGGDAPHPRRGRDGRRSGQKSQRGA